MPTTSPVTTIEAPPEPRDGVDAGPLTPDEVVERQREQFGGVKVGSAFFGWLIAMGDRGDRHRDRCRRRGALGLWVLPEGRTSGLGPLDADTVGWIGVGALLVMLLAAFYCGGYVAGRMARFSGIVQGLAVWVWAIVFIVVVGIVAVVLDGQYWVLADGIDGFSRIASPAGSPVIVAIVIAFVVAIVTLGGALLGGMVGVRYHRRVDQVGSSV